jgi:hypothetical protein
MSWTFIAPGGPAHANGPASLIALLAALAMRGRTGG